MSIDRVPASPEQIKAVASPLRLRILRLCNDREWTNKQLADRLERDPATIHHHVRLLVASDLLEAGDPRQGPSGAFEKPYRSTGLSWRLMFPEMNEEGGDQAANLPMLVAFQEELAESGARSISAATRFQLHLSSQEARAFERRLSGLIDDMMKGDDERREQGSPKHGGIFVLHELADPS